MFQYQPLNSSKAELRLMELLPSDDVEGTIRCVLSHVDLTMEHPPYLALSYTWNAPYGGMPPAWDDPESTKSITLNGEDFQVRYNLHSALYHIRQIRSDKTYLWVDAICIDQNNDMERNAQVPRIWSVYENAKDTVIWLGPAAEGSDLAMAKMWEIMAHRGSRTLSHNTVFLLRGQEKPTAHLVELIRLEIGLDERPWHAIKCLLLRSWWSRVWTFQEAVVSESAMAICGLKFAFWQAIEQTVLLLDEAANAEETIPPQMLDVFGRVAVAGVQANLLITYQKTRTRKPPDDRQLLETLSLLRNRDAGNPRDKVFAALAFSKETLLIEPNYSSSIEEVYTSLARQYILEHNNLDILGYASSGSAHRLLPSWVPDWRKRNQGTPFIKRSHGRVDFFYRACAERQLRVMFPDDGFLCLRGCILDSVEAIGSFMHFQSEASEYASYIWSIIQGWGDMLNSYGKVLVQVPEFQVEVTRASNSDPEEKTVLAARYPHTGETLNEAFEKTMFADTKVTATLDYHKRLSHVPFVSWKNYDPSDSQ